MRASARLEVLARQKDGRAEEREPPRRSLVSAVVSDESEGRRKKKKHAKTKTRRLSDSHTASNTLTSPLRVCMLLLAHRLALSEPYGQTHLN